MNPRLATLLKLGRDRYKYPWARVAAAPGTSTAPAIPIPLTSALTLYGESTKRRITDIDLDGYHHSLLDSLNAFDRRLGCASAIYWGHITRNEPFARRKVENFRKMNLHRNVSARIFSCAMHCRRMRWGDALKALHGLRELQRLPFASKVVAFIDPHHAGVYDNRINRFLSEKGLGNLFLGPDGSVPIDGDSMRKPQVGLQQNQRRYQHWCLRLQQLACALNTATPAAQWICTERDHQAWRAVDVERALFSFADRRNESLFPGRDADELVSLLNGFLTAHSDGASTSGCAGRPERDGT